MPITVSVCAPTVQSALQQGYLSLSQALELYRQARLQNLVSYRDALLATEPCTTQVGACALVEAVLP